jgi:hypothetical protein
VVEGLVVDRDAPDLAGLRHALGPVARRDELDAAVVRLVEAAAE